MNKQVDALIPEVSHDGFLSWVAQNELAEKTGVSLREIEDRALAQGILPTRYKCNLNAISANEQHTLFKARVAVVGCGGLGGHIIEELARLGIGTITAWDYDVFQEHNLNRQLSI